MIQAMQTVHRRLIVEIGQGAGDDATMRVAVEFARGLSLSLHGVFIEDESLLHLAALPFAREIRLPSHRWQPMDAGRLAAELRLAADSAQRRLRQAAAGVGPVSGVPQGVRPGVVPQGVPQGVVVEFEVLRGQPHLCIGGVCTPTDIFVVSAIAGGNPRGVALLRAAEESTAAVLLAPNQIMRGAGPGVVVADGTDDADLALAARLAGTNNERVTIVLPADAKAGASPVGASFGDLGVAPDRLSVRTAHGLGPDDVLGALADMRERIVIITKTARGQWGLDEAARFACIRGVPVLVL